MGEKGNEAANVTGPNGEAVRGSPYAADRRRGFRQWYYPRGRGGGPRSRRPPRESQSEGDTRDGTASGGEGGGQGPPPRRYRPRRGRGGYGGGYYNRGPYRGPPSDQDPNGGSGDGGLQRSRGPPQRRYYRRNNRGGRGGGGGGGGRRPHSQNSQGQPGDQDGGQNNGPRGGQQQRPRYRRRGPPRPRGGYNQQNESGNAKVNILEIENYIGTFLNSFLVFFFNLNCTVVFSSFFPLHFFFVLLGSRIYCTCKD